MFELAFFFYHTEVQFFSGIAVTALLISISLSESFGVKIFPNFITQTIKIYVCTYRGTAVN